VEKITLGPARHILLNPVDRECTAYHESGHPLLGLLVPGSDPVQRVAIVPRVHVVYFRHARRRPIVRRR
jgi:cell division protease FtsH